MWPPLLQTLEEYRDTILWGRLPGLAQQPPQVIGKSVLLGEFDADHGKDRTLTVIDADEKVGDDDVLDIGGIELGEKLLPQSRDGSFDVGWRKRLGRRWLEPRIVDVLSVGGPRGRAGDGHTTTQQERSAIHLCLPYDGRRP
jgi:hypothetical protein